MLLLPVIRRKCCHVRLIGPFTPAGGGVQPVASEILYSLGRQVLGEKSDKIGGIEELKVFFEVLDKYLKYILFPSHKSLVGGHSLSFRF